MLRFNNIFIQFIGALVRWFISTPIRFILGMETFDFSVYWKGPENPVNWEDSQNHRFANFMTFILLIILMIFIFN